MELFRCKEALFRCTSATYFQMVQKRKYVHVCPCLYALTEMQRKNDTGNMLKC